MRKALITFAALLCILLPAAAGGRGKVNLFMGTAGDHGQVSPAAQVPFGLASVCPDSEKPSHVGYDFDDKRISGISVCRISGVGGEGAGGNLRILPARVGAVLERTEEKAVPGYYETLLSSGTRVRLTSSAHVALEQYTFPAGEEAVLSVDFLSAIDPRRSECAFSIVDDRRIEGRVRSSTVCNFGAYQLYFRLETDCPFRVERSDEATAVLCFEKRTVEVRIGLSSIDEASAAAELAALDGRSFSRVRRDAARAWDRVLDRIDVKGSTPEQQTLFYTGLYRVYLSPFDATFGGRFRGADGTVRPVEEGTFYSGWSMWDTFRTKFPLLNLLSPAESADFCRSLIRLYKSGKRNWATMTEPVPTVRTEHSQVALLDAWSKGIRGFDLAEAFPAMEQEAAQGREPRSREGLTRNAPDQKMETAYDLWAMGRIASIVGNEEAARRYALESETLFEQTWKKEFMDIDGSYTLMKRNGLYQGTRWQYRWAVPVYADRMAAWRGSERLAGELAEFFSRHLFNQGNEPDIQTPFMFNLFGHPERTDSVVHALLTDERMVHLYGGNAEYPEPFVGRAFRNRTDGYAPEMDEDDGAMSAWYLFAQMGLYPVCPGTDRYVLFTPLFEKVTLRLPGGTVRIRRRCAPASASRVVVDGRPLEDFSITHAALTRAKEIVFE